MSQSFHLRTANRQQKRPFLTAKTPKGPRSLADDNTPAVPDRFTAPVASISFNSLGEPVYGLPERPMTACTRQQFELQKARENERALDHMAAKPTGRRHDAYTDYLQRIAMGDQKTSFEALEKRGMNRIARTHHPVFQSSHDNPLHRLPEKGSDEPRQPEPPMQAAANAAAEGAMPTANAESISPLRTRQHEMMTSLDFWHDIHGSSQAPRFAAHSAFDVAHNKQVAEEGARADARTRGRADYSQLVHATRDLEQKLSTEYPHGLPPGIRTLQAGQLRQARSHGLKIGPLGFGFPTSMTDQHTSIMRSTVKRPISATSFR